MKCEICHRAEAETVIRETTEGAVCERFVCHACARQREASSDEDAAPSLMVEILLGAAFSMPSAAGRDAHAAGEKPCPGCGMTRQEYRKRARLGCAGCYEHFARELQPVLRDMHRGERHTGKTPRQARAQVARQRLEAALAEAVGQQRFEEAARLRDELRALGPGPEAPPRDARRRHA